MKNGNGHPSYVVSHLSGEDLVTGTAGANRLTKLLGTWGFVGKIGKEISEHAVPKSGNRFLFQHDPQKKTFQLMKNEGGKETKVEEGTYFDSIAGGDQITFSCHGNRVDWQIVCQRNGKEAEPAPKIPNLTPQPPPPPIPPPAIEDTSPKKTESPYKLIGLKKIPIKKIKRFEIQPRQFFDLVKIDELAGSIEHRGIVKPVHVRKLEGDPEFDFELIDGERRVRSATTKGVVEIDALVFEVKDIVEQHLQSQWRIAHSP